jgi:hypothetical protein
MEKGESGMRIDINAVGIGIGALPDHAIVTGIATGDQDGRVGVYGSSVSNIGVYGDGVDNSGVYGSSKNEIGVYANSENNIGLFAHGKVLAGQFDGDVEIKGNLIVSSLSFQHLLDRINDLTNHVNDLTNGIAALEASGRTDEGARINTPPSRPIITVTQDTPANGGEAKFTITGDGFVPNSSINVRVLDALGRPHDNPSHANDQGSIFVPFHVGCAQGDVLNFAAHDTRPDNNDLSGILWSSPVLHTCF